MRGLFFPGAAVPVALPLHQCAGVGVPYTWDCENADMWDELERHLDGEITTEDCVPAMPATDRLSNVNVEDYVPTAAIPTTDVALKQT